MLGSHCTVLQGARIVPIMVLIVYAYSSRDQPDLPTDVLSLTQLRMMPLPDMVRAIIKNG